MNNLIPNEDLKKEMLPSIQDEKGIRKFAATFHGYEYLDSNNSFKQNVRNRTCLSDLRGELFLAWRATRHNEGIDLVEVYKELYPLFIKFLDEKS